MYLLSVLGRERGFLGVCNAFSASVIGAHLIYAIVSGDFRHICVMAGCKTKGLVLDGGPLGNLCDEVM